MNMQMRFMSSEPAIEVPLPGKIMYEEKCHLTPLTLFDVKEISNAVITDNQEQLDRVIQRRCSLNLNDLLEPDYVFIMYWMRKNSYETYDFLSSWRCPECKHDNSSEVPIKYDNLEKDYRDVKLNLSTGPTKIRLPKHGDLLLAESMIEEESNRLIKEKKPPIPDDEEIALYETIKYACMLEPNGGSLDDRMKLIYSMTPDDVWAITIFERDYAYGVHQNHIFPCSKCSREQGVTSVFHPTRFLPGNVISENIQNRVYVNDDGAKS